MQEYGSSLGSSLARGEKIKSRNPIVDRSSPEEKRKESEKLPSIKGIASNVRVVLPGQEKKSASVGKIKGNKKRKPAKKTIPRWIQVGSEERKKERSKEQRSQPKQSKEKESDTSQRGVGRASWSKGRSQWINTLRGS